MRRTLALVALAAALAAGARAQSPATDPKPQPGSISGHVTINGKPAPGVFVRLPRSDFEPGQGRPASTMTDADGRYEFAEVPPGRYFLSPYTPAYVGPNLGWGYAGAHVTVAPGEAVKNVDVALTRGGVVTGRVTDAEGRPIVRQPVYLLGTNESGKHQAVEVPNMQFMMTDDRGVYRIYGVPPGRYLVSVGKQTDQQLMMVPTDASRNYPLTYYPGTGNEADATVVAIESGVEARNIDIAVGRAAATYKATGRVISDGANGGVPPSYMVLFGAMKEGQKTLIPTGRATSVNEKGEFRLEGLAPGTYGVIVIPQFGTPGSSYSDTAVFRVDGADVTGVEVRLHTGATLSGTLVMEGVTDPAVLSKLSQYQIAAIVDTGTDDTAMSPIPTVANVTADGSFQLTGIRPGTVKLWLADWNAPKGFAIARIDRDGAPIENGFQLNAGDAVTGVRVTISHGTGVIRGQVTFESGTRPQNVEIFAVVRRPGSTDIQRPSRIDERGQFLIEGLAPGTYEVTLRLWSQSTQKLLGFKPEPTQTVTVSNGADATVKIVVAADAETVEVKL